MVEIHVDSVTGRQTVFALKLKRGGSEIEKGAVTAIHRLQKTRTERPVNFHRESDLVFRERVGVVRLQILQNPVNPV